MKEHILVFLCLFILICTCSDVIQVSDKNFKEVVIDSGKFTLVDFYADWCRHCQNLMPEYEKVAEKFASEPDIQIAKINGDKDGKKMVKKYNIPGFPMLVFFHGNKEPVEFEGNREAESISNFVQQLSGRRLDRSRSKSPVMEESHVLELSDLNFEQLILASLKKSFISFTALWCVHCQELEPIWNELADKVFVNDELEIQFGRVQTNEVDADELTKRFRIESFPTIIFIDPQNFIDDKGTIAQDNYDGERSLEALVRFVNDKSFLHRKTDGQLDESAGRINKVDLLINDKLRAKGKEKEAIRILDKLNQILSMKDEVVSEEKQFQSNDFSMEHYYRKLLNKIINGDDGHFSKEYSRLNKLLKDQRQNLHPKAIDSMQKRANILNQFVN
ncbi:uncharacterized protein PRCAT00002930001 [Priceomyces carsonii]|uniref:uncharacterized protein n=1 Tax=Priceomyces carsonii TaxID=28549 RepID=UPI002ED7E4AF|nr:unnamed protein product [Priceomyces carsonii]